MSVHHPAAANLAVAKMSRLVTWYEQAAEAAYAAVQGISAQDERTIREATDRLRQFRYFLSTGDVHESVSSGLDDASPLDLQRMRHAVEVLQMAQTVIDPWREQLTPHAVEGSLRWHRLMDVSLPMAWQFETDLLLVVGPAGGDLLQALRERGQRRVLFIHESDAADALDLGCGMAVVSEVQQLDAYLQALSSPWPKHLVRIQLGDEEATDLSLALHDRAHKAIMQRWMNDNTVKMFARDWVRQGILNMPAIAQQHNLSELDGLFQGKPAILISPGPSLDRNIHELKKAQGRAVLIAPLQSLRRLYKAGVRPDFLLVLDPTDLSTEPYDFFNDVPDEFLGTLIVGVNCHPNVIRRFRRVYFFAAGGPLDHWVAQWIGQPLVHLDAASVAISGLLLARHWGCQPIVLTGQDLALASDGQRYAQDAQLNNFTQSRLLRLSGYYGGEVLTPSDYFLFHHQFERIADEMAQTHPQVQLLNCTEGGAFIQGFDHRPLHDVLRECVEAQPLTDWLCKQQSRDEPSRQLQRLTAARNYLTSVSSATDVCERQARQCERLTRSPNQGLKALSAAEARLRQQLRSLRGFAVPFQERIELAMRAATEAKSMQANLAASRQLFAVVVEACVFVRASLDEALSVLDREANGGCGPHSPPLSTPVLVGA